MITKVFQSGNSQAVRIPKELRLEHDEVEIFRRGDELVLRPVQRRSAGILFDVLADFEGEIERPEIRIDERDGS